MQLSSDCIELELLKGVYHSFKGRRILWIFIELAAMGAHVHLEPNTFKALPGVL